MRVVDLSHTIVSGMAQYPGDEVTPRLVRKQTHAVDGFLSTLLELGCHVGTHIDTPYHFLDGQPGLEAIPLTAFQGRALVVDAPARHEPGPVQVEVLAGVDLPATDYLIFRTGWERHWGADRYYACWPYLAPELARQLVDAELKGVGLDTPSVDPHGGHAVHDLFAAAGMVNVENLANLGALPTTFFEFMALPLKLAGTEASPVRAVALIGPTA